MLNERISKRRSDFVYETIKPFVQNPLVLNAFLKVDRKDFTPVNSQRDAYKDQHIELPYNGSSMSQPSVVAQMMEAADLTGYENVLEVGSASGYGAALLSVCAEKVTTIEHKETLAKSTGRILHRKGFDNVTVVHGDGALGRLENGPYDIVIVTAGALSIPKNLVDQLDQNGRIIVPVGNDLDHLSMIKGVKYNNKLHTKVVSKERYSFHPLFSPYSGGWTLKDLQRFDENKILAVDEYAKSLGMTLEQFVKYRSLPLNEVINPYEFNYEWYDADYQKVLRNHILPNAYNYLDKVLEEAESTIYL